MNSTRDISDWLRLADLLLLYPSYSPVRILDIDIAHIVPLALVDGIGHWLTGSVNVLMLLSLLVVSVPAIILGSHLAHRV